MRPASHLYQFLASQDHLKELIGVDMFASRRMELHDSFLPSLRTLVCDDPHTACSLLPRRPISTLQVFGQLSYDQLRALSASIPQQHHSLTTVTLCLVSSHGKPHPTSFLRALLSSIPFVRKLEIVGCYGGGDEDALLLSRLRFLEDLSCVFYPRTWADTAKAAWLVSCGPNLKRVLIWPEGAWVRDNRYGVHFAMTYCCLLPVIHS